MDSEKRQETDLVGFTSYYLIPKNNIDPQLLGGEIDLMKYYKDYYDIPRTIITQFDLLKELWLTKIKIE